MKVVLFLLLVLLSQASTGTSYGYRAYEGDPDLPFLRTFVRNDDDNLKVIVNGIQPNPEKSPYLVAVPSADPDIKLVGYGVLGSAIQAIKPGRTYGEFGSFQGWAYIAVGVLLFITMPSRVTRNKSKYKALHEALIFLAYFLWGFVVLVVWATAAETQAESITKLTAKSAIRWCVENGINLSADEQQRLTRLDVEGWTFAGIGSTQIPSKPALLQYKSNGSTLPLVFSSAKPARVAHELVIVGKMLGQVEGREVVRAAPLTRGGMHPDLYDLMKEGEFTSYSRAGMQRNALDKVQAVKWSDPIPVHKKIGRLGRPHTISLATGMALVCYGALLYGVLALFWPTFWKQKVTMLILACLAMVVGFWYEERQFTDGYRNWNFLPDARLGTQLWVLHSLREKPLKQPYFDDWYDRERKLFPSIQSRMLEGGPWAYGITTDSSGDSLSMTFNDSKGNSHLVVQDGQLTPAADLVGTADW